jgi:hypothetical protein
MSELYTDKKRDLTKHKSKSRTFFPSRKMHGSIVTECPLEASLCYYLEFDDSITSYESQPLGYYYQYEGKRTFTRQTLKHFVVSSHFCGKI